METEAELHSEAVNLFQLAKSDALTAFEIVERQLAVVVLRTQVMLSLSGIVITVTGFSGRAVAQTGPLARLCISTGIFFVLAAAAVAISGVMRLKWLTQTIEPDAIAMLKRGLAIRNRKSRFLSFALALFLVGFTLYCVAIAQLLMSV